MSKQKIWTVVKYVAVAAASYYGGPAAVDALNALWKALGG